MKELVQRYPALSFLGFIVVWTWIFMGGVIALVPIDPIAGPQFVHVALVFFLASPSVLGLLFARIVDGKGGIRSLLDRVRRWRVRPIWFAVSLLLIPTLAGLIYVVQYLLWEPLEPIDLGAKLAFAVPISLLAAVMEEFGWRGFALPRLLERHSALKAALIVGVGWALWHAPINVLGVQKFGMQAAPILVALAILPIAQTVIMTWIYNSTRQSMLMMLLTHFSITCAAILFALPNPTAGDELRSDLMMAGMFLLAAMVIVLAAGAKDLARVAAIEDGEEGGVSFEEVEA